MVKFLKTKKSQIELERRWYSKFSTMVKFFKAKKRHSRVLEMEFENFLQNIVKFLKGKEERQG